MKNQKNKNRLRVGFTLIEIMTVIAIIGILASVVTVSLQGGVDKSKTASAITTMSSLLPEIVTCQDDGGRISAYSAGAAICIQAGSTTALTGHENATWPNILAKTGYAIIKAGITANVDIQALSFTATKTGQPTITCDYSDNECTIP
ncbi:MAG TPA: hypothetical protein DEA43_02640 [Candidatus Moranbacteria bacterium]|nr:hypothetical protein [Candidatus Moranbacteria bacterium]HBT45761.1 hypothetical protein [Candidatus Moranbacteria bacterium]